MKFARSFTFYGQVVISEKDRKNKVRKGVSDGRSKGWTVSSFANLNVSTKRLEDQDNCYELLPL